jgi:integrase
MKDKKDLTFKDFQNFKSALIKAGRSQSADFFTIVFNTGLRISDVLNLKFIDVDFKSTSINIEKLKSSSGEQARYIMNDECMQTLRKLKDEYPNDVFVFQSRKSKNQKNKPASSISRQVVTDSFKAVSNSTALPISIRSVRESFAVQLLKESLSSGSDSANLSKVMGHVSTNMTKHYMRIRTIKNHEKLDCISALKADISNGKTRVVEYLLNGTPLKENSDLDDICQKYEISESDLLITLKTMKVLREFC